MSVQQRKAENLDKSLNSNDVSKSDGSIHEDSDLDS